MVERKDPTKNMTEKDKFREIRSSKLNLQKNILNNLKKSKI
jgi:hypothetical protein